MQAFGEGSEGNGGTVGIALGSGAAKGWAHIGVIRALGQAGIRPQCVCGSSMGAVVGAAYAAGVLDEFEAWGRRLEWRQMVGYFDLSFRGGLIRARRLFEFFEDVLRDRTIESLDLPFAAVATDLATGQEIWLREGNLLDALRATIALPGLITPVKWQGQWLVDGGLVNPVPVSLCRVLGAERVVAVDLNTSLVGRRLNARAVEPIDLEPAVPELEAGVGGRLNSLMRELAGELRERFSGDGAEGDGDRRARNERDEVPSIYEVIANSVNIMQLRIGRSRMAGDPPELLVTPRMSDFGLLDFDRAEEAMAEGSRAVSRALASV